MSRFEELNNNLMDVLIELISSQNLCKLLTYTSLDPLDESEISDTSALLFDKIYPIPKIPTVVDTQGSFLTVIFDDIRLSKNISFKDSVILFNILCHIDVWRTNGALRPYGIMNEIDLLFNNKRVIGIGKMQFSRARFIAVNDKYMGFRVEYNLVDFN